MPMTMWSFFDTCEGCVSFAIQAIGPHVAPESVLRRIGSPGPAPSEQPPTLLNAAPSRASAKASTVLVRGMWSTTGMRYMHTSPGIAAVQHCG